VTFDRLMALLLAVAAAACSSGGGGGMNQNVASGTSASTTAPSPPAPSPPAPNYITDTGIAGTVAAPAAATFSTTPPQLATPGGPTFDGSSGSSASNITFPLLAAGLQKTSTGLSPTPADPAAILTVVSSSPANTQLIIPSLGINQQIYFGASLGSKYPDNGNAIYGLSYTAVGFWGGGIAATNPAFPLSVGVYVFGLETPQAAMPTSGTAVFSGQGLATTTVYKTVGTEIQSANVGGNASISVNFGSGAINGSLTQMQVAPQQPWNDVSVTANIATGSNRFSGTAAAASAPGTPMSLSASAVGKINGAFYGPAAQNLGAVWSLSDGTGSALGTVVAGH
jgi:hypothetical protein